MNRLEIATHILSGLLEFRYNEDDSAKLALSYADALMLEHERTKVEADKAWLNVTREVEAKYREAEQVKGS